MSATTTAKRGKVAGSAATTRLRKIECSDCGYVCRVTRSWLARGLPTCCCGGTLEPTDPADMAYAGLITASDVPARVWNEIARVNGWALNLNHGQIVAAERAGRDAHRLYVEAVHPGPAHCAYPGCGMWVSAGAERCSHGHAQDGSCAGADAPSEDWGF